MKRIAIVPWIAAMVLGAVRVDATPDIALDDVWHNAWPSNRHDKVFGDVTWLSINLSTNSVVTWEWSRNGKSETHSGGCLLKSREVPKGQREITDLIIMPTTLDVQQAIVWRDVSVKSDGRFPALWTLLKWFDEAGNQNTFVRQSVLDEWRVFRDLLDKADKAAPRGVAPAPASSPVPAAEPAR